MTILQRYTKRDYDRNYAAGYWSSDHLLETIAATASRKPDQVAVVDGDCRLTWREVVALVDRVAATLSQEGVREGDLVAVQLPNSAHIVVIALALIKLGALFHGVNTSYRTHDLTKIFNRSRPAFYVYTPSYRGFEYGPMVAELQAAGMNFKPRIVDVDQLVEASFAPAGPLPADLPAPDPDAIILIGATSGSTGDPKLFMHSHNTQFNEARALNREMGLGTDDVFLGFAPITHRGVFMWGLMMAMAAGATFVVQRIFDQQAIIDAIDREKVTSLFAIPSQVGGMLDLCERDKGDGNSLRVLMMAGAPVQPELVVRIRKVWPGCAPVTGFGSSETGYAVITRPEYPLEELQTCGQALQGIEIAIDRVDPNDGSGEVLLRGAFVSPGYYDDQKATDAAFSRDGWFHTGDLGHLDQNGNVIITGRSKNVIIRSGLKIQAEEIEHVLLRHASIAQAVIVGIEDPQVGERSAACIVSRDKPLTLDEVNAFLSQQGVAKFKWPEGIRMFDELPMNAVGKFDRIVLRRQLNNGT